MADKNALMASLLLMTGDGDGVTSSPPEQDLFGDVVPPSTILLDANVTPSPSLGVAPTESQPPPEVGAPPTATPPLQAPTTSSLLAQSGLLMQSMLMTTMTATDPSVTAGMENGSGGLFDAVDEEQERLAAQERARLQQQQLLLQQQQQQAAAQAAAEQMEAQRKQQEQQQQQAEAARQLQQQMQQQQMMQQQSYGGYGSNSTYPPVPPQQHYLQQPQPQPLQNTYLQQSAMMQSVNLNATAGGPPINTYAPTTTNTTPQQRQLQAGMQNLSLQQQQQPPTQGFYREHPPSVITTVVPPPVPNNTYGGAAAATAAATAASPGYYYGTQQYPQMATVPTTPSRIAGAGAAGSATGAMRMIPQNGSIGNNNNNNNATIRKITFVKPPMVPPIFTNIKVTEPMLIQPQSFLISSPPYWSYQISTQLVLQPPPNQQHHPQQQQHGMWLVRRRFKHVVALEDRLRHACPGCILPPRPDKHATRALEEASAHQSAEFALQRAKELEQYLNGLATHPVAGQTQVLRLFLGLQDDIGTAWPEVSGNAFTKLGAVAAGVSAKVAETTNMTTQAAAAARPVYEWEEDAELLALTNSEQLRMGAVSQAVPKLEGTVSVVREQGDAAGALGMELSKMTKVPLNDELKCFDTLSHGMLRMGRRNKRLALELSAAMDSFLQQYKMVRYEKMALNDRRQAIQRKNSTRRGADQRAMYLAQQQRQLQATGQFGQLNQLEQSAIYTDSFANAIVGEAEELAARLKLEIHRVAIDRRIQWNASMKTIAVAMKEAASETVAIWESTLEGLKALPGGLPVEPLMVNGVASPSMPASGTMPLPPAGAPPQLGSIPVDGSMMMGSSQPPPLGGMSHPPSDMARSMMMSQQQQQQQQYDPSDPLDGSTIYA